MTIKCECGHEAPFEAFTTRPVSGDLPPGSYQCPACNRAWTIVKGKIEFWPWGDLKRNDKNTLKVVPPVL